MGTETLVDQIQRRLPGPLRRNLRLKALAAVLALVCWTVVVYASDPPDTRTLSIDVPTRSLPAQFVLDPAPGQLTIRVRGTRAHLDNFHESSLSVSAAFDTVRARGTQTVAVAVTNSDPDVDLDQPPTSVTVSVDALDSRSIPVSVTVVDAPPAGYSFNSQQITVSPASVAVFGASQRLSDLHAFVDVSLTGIKTTFESNPRVFLYQGQNPANRISNLAVQPASVVVDVPVTSNTVSRASAVVPSLTGSVGPGRVVSAISVSPPFVVLNGPQELLASLDSVSTEPVRLNGLVTTGRETVRVIAPQGVSVDPVQVSVIITVTPLSGTLPPTPVPTATPSPTPTPTPTVSPIPGG